LKEKLEGDGVTKKKPKTLKTRKSIGKGKRKEDADDSADDFKPSAAAAKTKPRDVDQAPRKRIVSNTIVKEDETDVVIGKSKTAAVKPSAAAPVKKPKTISLDDSEDEAESSNTKQKPAKQQNTLKRKP
jgi:DNA topoisomerase II